MQGQESILERMLDGVEAASALLAMTTSLADENTIKNILLERGYKFAVTELGGDTANSEFWAKTTRAIIGACLNCGVISKNAREVHAVLHAAEDAKHGFFPNMTTDVNISCKVAVVRNDEWIVVTLYGKSAVHYITNHKRIGMGIMHI